MLFGVRILQQAQYVCVRGQLIDGRYCFCYCLFLADFLLVKLSVQCVTFPNMLLGRPVKYSK